MADAIVAVAEDIGPGINKIKWTWTSATGGTASGTTSLAYTGKVYRVVTDPDGTAAPSDNYDITITDDDGVDVLDGNGANRDTATTEAIAPAAVLVGSKLTLSVTNAGDEKAGVVYVYITDNV